MSIGENLKVLRKKAKKNQTKFAKDIGISRTYLSDLEHNRKSLSIDTIEKIAKKLNVPVTDLLYSGKSLDAMFSNSLDNMKKNASNDEIKKSIISFQNIVQKEKDNKEFFDLFSKLFSDTDRFTEFDFLDWKISNMQSQEEIEEEIQKRFEAYKNTFEKLSSYQLENILKEL
ncbi:helix-turn-helix domain-containing protein [uncultured Enterococcus sp.]|jgi:transcriptional regulator with XRE-family HTH domain|nr:helix-turn-helix transcriptional regulator [uncultured Enterococcus sp.]HCS30607.1 hypothetical protein [Enterococcus sp.]